MFAFMLVLLLGSPTILGLSGKPGKIPGAAHLLEQKKWYCPVAGSRARGWKLQFCADVNENTWAVVLTDL